MSLPLLSSHPLGFRVDEGPAAPPWRHRPTVEWQICGACNYDCSYCIQSKRHRVGYPSAAELEAMLHFLAELPGTWEIKMTGGEPFSSRLFLKQVVPALIQMPHTISVITNLSASKSQLERFASMVHGRLGIVSASLHLEFTDVDSFLSRLTALAEASAPEASFVVNGVLAPAHLSKMPEVKARVEGAGFRFYPQLMKIKGGVHPYAPAELAVVREVVGDLERAAQTRSANMAPAYTGQSCFTGSRYFVMLQDGEVYSCRSAKREGHGYMGNAVEGNARLLGGPHACPYTICPCAVPANRGMIEGVLASGAKP
jgi:MoaA/NifB/PqqE/SkfB family radical SAM enzyme